MNKTLYCIRHGTALHNVLFWDYGSEVYQKYRDTPLVAKGVEEAKNLGKTWKEIDNIELVLVSPLLRTLQTASHIFENKNIPMLALDCIMEYPQGYSDICNHRKTIIELKPCYPNIDFSSVNKEKDIWRPDRDETINELNGRINELINFIKSRKEKHIAIVSHSSYLGHFLFNKIGDENNELEHCMPYIHKL
jgi:broad specificity phosphatase PhoE